MVDVVATNAKLRGRVLRILQEASGAERGRRARWRSSRPTASSSRPCCRCSPAPTRPTARAAIVAARRLGRPGPGRPRCATTTPTAPPQSLTGGPVHDSSSAQVHRPRGRPRRHRRPRRLCSLRRRLRTPAGGGKGTTLTVWSWRVEDEAAYTKIFDAYEKAHPGVTVDFKAFKATEYNKILATGLAGSDGPDVPQVRSYGQLQTTVASDALVPLDGKVDLAGWDDNVVASAKGKEDGKIYSVPLARQTTVMFYNEDAFAKNGLKAPTTWDEFMAANTKLASAGMTPIAVGAKDDWTLPIVHEVLAAPRFGGKAFQDQVASGSKDFTDPDWVASVKVVKDLEKFMPKNVTGVAVTDAQTLFTAGKAAMLPGGSYDLAVLQKANPQMKIGVMQVAAAARLAERLRGHHRRLGRRQLRRLQEVDAPGAGHRPREVDVHQGVRPDGRRRRQADLRGPRRRVQGPAAQVDGRQLPEVRLALPAAHRLPLRRPLGHRPARQGDPAAAPRQQGRLGGEQGPRTPASTTWFTAGLVTRRTGLLSSCRPCCSSAIFVLYPMGRRSRTLLRVAGHGTRSVRGPGNFPTLFTRAPFTTDLPRGAAAQRRCSSSGRWSSRTRSASRWRSCCTAAPRTRRLLQTLYAMPYLVSPIVIGYLWTLLLSPTFGPVNQLLTKVGLESWALPVAR